MLQRIYGVYGLMDYTINVRLGNRVLKIPFTGGATTGNGVRPATYTTNNPVVQYAIESSPIFKSGRVKIIRSIGQAEPTPKAATATATEKESETAATTEATEAKADGETVTVSCWEDAREYLIKNYAGKASNLRYPKNIKEFAAQCGVTFAGVE